ncbi:hypothetical protein EJ05DRAFT_474301 [Pseudovirgaria hyperparasitica]|uniref:Uncharacterized protein n=1 Tax=Pseudovirgaria hyperparasitica TaxID=470096 RepID=A0A6A6WEW0_9PEZI|nr:uncharacterized protein EJ05DRAFT_474301 [Pseudovirgaria hyperparasitica]KAF2760426.1 hypothetical protein EJ05DRAFT_474301 [Pseudovirgaria hyperparasitica]
MTSRTPVDLYGKAALPPCDGPRLKPFKYRKESIEFVSLLSEPPSSSPTGACAHVFKVKFGKRGYYALKIFKFKKIQDLRGEQWALSNENVSDDDLVFHSDPFYAECRAYGKIEEIEESMARKSSKASQRVAAQQIQSSTKQTKRKSRSQKNSRSQVTSKHSVDREAHRLAVPCYGFMGLPPTFEALLAERFGIFDWDRSSSDESMSQDIRAPFRALVKQLVENKPAFGRPRKMLADLKILRAHEIYQKDIAARNYMNGLLVDFGAAWTSPHWCLETLSRNQLHYELFSDLFEWDHMMREEIPSTVVRAAPLTSRLLSLRDYRELGHDMKYKNA